jgi:protocatechuate 3,4-dioxygenase beta subunit
MKSTLLLACLCAAGPLASGYQSATGSIEGQVVNLNTGRPVGRATVSLNNSTGRPTRPGQPPPQYNRATTETDDQGKFVFPNLEPGGYNITAQRQGYAGQNVGYQMSSQLFLGAQQQLQGVVVKLTPQAVITGKVLDQNGDPLERASVNVIREQYYLGTVQWMNSGSGQTNDLGEYRIAGITPGQYRLSATYRGRMMYSLNQALPDKPEMTYVTTYYPDVTDLAAAKLVNVNAGAETRADIQLKMAATVRIRGRIIDPSGSNQMASVTLVSKNGVPGAMSMGAITAGASSADGSFEVTGAVPGDYFLLARKNVSSGMASNANSLGAVLPITVGDKPIDGAVLRLAPSRDVKGTVQVEGNTPVDLRTLTIQTNSLDGLNGGPMPFVRGIEGSEFTLKNVAPGRSTITVFNASATYYVKSIQYGGKEVTASGEDLTTGGSLAIVLSTNGAQLAGRVMDADGKPPARINLTLVPSGGQAFSLEQAGADRNGEFRFRMLRPGEYKLYAWESADNTITQNPDALKQFDAKAQSVKLEPGGKVVATVPLISAAETAGILAAPPSVVEFAHVKGSLEGLVLDAKTGAPISNTLVRLTANASGFAGAGYAASGMVIGSRPGASGVTTQTDEQGHFVFHDVEPGMYQLGAERQGFITGRYGQRRDTSIDPLIVGEGQLPSNVVMKLAPQAVVAGKVTDEYGDPVINAPVSLSRRETRLRTTGLVIAGRGTTNSLGEFRIASLAAGTYTLSVRPVTPMPLPDTNQPVPDQPEMRYPVTYYPASLDADAAKPIVVESGAEITGLDMTLHKTATFEIRGTLDGVPARATASTAPQQPPARTPTVQLYPDTTQHTQMSPVGLSSLRDGAFAIADVRPGNYILVARAPAENPAQFLAAVQPIEVKDKNVDGVKLTLKPGREVKASVSIEDKTSLRLNGLFVNLVSVYPLGTGASAQVMNDETSMTFHAVLPLPYRVDVTNLPYNCHCFVKSIRYGGREIPDSGVDLTTGGPIEMVVGTNAALVEGTIVDGQGKPVGGAAVALVPKDGSLTKLRTGTADDNGKYFFDNNPPGDYKLLAWEDIDPAALNEPGFAQRFDASAKLVTLEPSGRQTVRLMAIPAK